MFSNPMSLEMIRIVHERQLHEAAIRQANLRLADPGRERPALRQLVGSALIRVGRALADDPADPAPEGQDRRGKLRLLPRLDEGGPDCRPSTSRP